METAINVPRENLEAVMDRIDRFFIDVKTLNGRIYREYTGKDNDQVLQNLQLLVDKCPEKIGIRVPMIKGYNDRADCEQTKRLLTEMGIEDIEIFKYRTGLSDEV
ncbi:hypothetical protein [[Clostridium] aminophilum]|nr:hypothetical protein [[Clostridium] aminophilum]